MLYFGYYKNDKLYFIGLDGVKLDNVYNMYFVDESLFEENCRLSNLYKRSYRYLNAYTVRFGDLEKSTSTIVSDVNLETMYKHGTPVKLENGESLVPVYVLGTVRDISFISLGDKPSENLKEREINGVKIKAVTDNIAKHIYDKYYR